jgi:hypothetical protein
MKVGTSPLMVSFISPKYQNPSSKLRNESLRFAAMGTK